MSRSPRGSRRRRGALLALIAAALGATVVVVVLLSRRTSDDIPPTRGLAALQEDLDAGDVETVTLADSTGTAHVKLEDGTTYDVRYPDGFGPDLTADLLEAGIDVEVEERPAEPPLWADLLVRIGPLLVVFGLLGWLLLRRGGLLGGIMSVRRNRSAGDIPDTRFGDVAGLPEIVDELREIVSFLEDPARFLRLGARVPRGVLLTGPPGTGKTLLARAVAGEAGVPFIAISGSDFVEMFAGLGASRMRNLFDDARKAERAIVFIDEIDAVGKARVGQPSNGASEERENTLNQLLVELDGFTQDETVFVLAATNRPDVLDPALLRAGRFDRTLEVPTPDRRGREEILAVHARAVPGAGRLDWGTVAASTPGMTGADLANIVNEAAILAARRGHETVEEGDMLDAVGVVTMGPERRSRVLNERDRRISAWHEAGHVVCALVQTEAPVPHRVSIVPRGRAGGVTWLLPDDNDLLTLRQARAQLVVALGGRAAEERLMEGDMTHGAASDLKNATQLARRMVVEFGMTDLGLASFEPEDLQLSPYSTDVHTAVQTTLDEAMTRARTFLTEHAPLLTSVSGLLLERETLDSADLADLRAQAEAVA
ncbi:MAG: AAA family ATPase [Acidimicrobiia bacterium]|nr:AAA family ATPase [Acidimicrobiia bacterium]